MKLLVVPSELAFNSILIKQQLQQIKNLRFHLIYILLIPYFSNWVKVTPQLNQYLSPRLLLPLANLLLGCICFFEEELWNHSFHQLYSINIFADNQRQDRCRVDFLLWMTFCK